MATDRQQAITFGELIEQGVLEIGDGYRAKNEELGGSGLIFLRAGHVTETHVHFEGADRFDETLTPRLQAKLSKPGDAIVTTKGNSTGRTAFVTADMPQFVYSPHLSYWRSKDPTQLEGGFLRYWSKSPEFTEQLSGMKASTDMAPYLSLVDQRRLRITLPSIEEQRAIAHILGALDDKIALNRRMSETLEAMARALFKSWFVDFDPVRAKAKVRPTGLPTFLDGLFPDSFEESELGEVPTGWTIGTIGDLATVVGGSTPNTANAAFWETGRHFWATPKDLSLLATPILLSTERQISDAGLAQVSSGLLPAGTVLLSSRAPIGYLAINEVLVAINQGFVAMLPKESVSNLFLLMWASAFHDEIVSRANGSTFLEISKANFRPIPIARPPVNLMSAFDRITRPMYQRLVVNEREIRAVTACRDALLPKLISGELRLKEANRVASSSHPTECERSA